MDKQQTKTTDQQDTNAALAALAAAGNSFALGQLWEINQGFLHRLFWQWYSKNKATADEHGLTLEDFDQEAFFAIRSAAQAYAPAKGSFLTLLSYYVQNQINRVVCGEHCRTCTTADGKQIRLSANPLDDCTSLDTPLDSTDAESCTLGDIQQDPAASQAFQTAEDELYTEELHAALEEALSKLPERTAHVLRCRYYAQQTLQAVGNELGVSRDRVRQIECKGIWELQKLPSLQRWHEDIISTRAWRGTGWNAWNRYGSVQERTAEYLEKREAERWDYPAWRDKVLREHYTELEASGFFERHPDWRPAQETA